VTVRGGKTDNHDVKAVLVCALGVCLMGIFLTRRPPISDDFRSFYRGAQLVGTQDGVFSHPASYPDTKSPGAYLPYIRIPAYALMLKPLTDLPYRTARMIWIGLLVLACAGSVALFAGPREKLAAALCFSLPVLNAIGLAQDIAFIVLIGLAVSRIASSGREFAAGLIASLLAIKPTYLLPVGIVFLARSRRGTFGLVLGTAVQLAVSFVLEGPGWPSRYLALLRNPMFDVEPRRMPNIRGIAASLALPPLFYIAASIALLAWLWIIARKLSLPEALIVALPLGMLASPHSYIYDGVVIIPLLVLMLSRHVPGVVVYLAALSPLPYIALLTNKVPLVLAGSTTVVAATVWAAWASRTSCQATNLQTRLPRAENAVSL